MEFRNITSRFGEEIVLNQVNFLPATPLMSTDLHSHFNMLHITYVKKGRGICRVKGEIWELTSGSVHFIMPGEIHRYVADAKNPYHIYFMHLKWYGFIPDELPRQLIAPRNKRKNIYKNIHELSELFSSNSYIASDFRKYGLFSLFLSDVLKFSIKTKTTPLKDYISGNSQDAKLNYVFKRLYGPPFEYPSINELSEQCEMSRRKFTALFKKITGMTVKQYYLQNVMTYASSMIENKELKIKDIASQCGYSNPQNFLYAYKRYGEI